MSETTDSFETLQTGWNEIKTLRDVHPEFFLLGTVYACLGGISPQALTIYGSNTEEKYAFAKAHQEANWMEESDEWTGVLCGVRLKLWGMKQNEVPKLPRPVLFPTAEDPTIGKDAGFLGTMGIVARPEPEFI